LDSEHRLNFLPKLGTLRAGCGTQMFLLQSDTVLVDSPPQVEQSRGGV
jgi:hypothetical protein